MNRAQKTVVTLGVLAFALAGLYPPWEQRFPVEPQYAVPAGRAWLFTGPQQLVTDCAALEQELQRQRASAVGSLPGDQRLVWEPFNCSTFAKASRSASAPVPTRLAPVDFAAVNVTRLMIEWAIIAVVVVGLVLSFTDKKLVTVGRSC